MRLGYAFSRGANAGYIEDGKWSSEPQSDQSSRLMLDLSDRSTQDFVRLTLYSAIVVVNGTIAVVRAISGVVKQFAESGGFQVLRS